MLTSSKVLYKEAHPSLSTPLPIHSERLKNYPLHPLHPLHHHPLQAPSSIATPPLTLSTSTSLSLLHYPRLAVHINEILFIHSLSLSFHACRRADGAAKVNSHTLSILLSKHSLYLSPSTL